MSDDNVDLPRCVHHWTRGTTCSEGFEGLASQVSVENLELLANETVKSEKMHLVWKGMD